MEAVLLINEEMIGLKHQPNETRPSHQWLQISITKGQALELPDGISHHHLGSSLGNKPLLNLGTFLDLFAGNTRDKEQCNRF